MTHRSAARPIFGGDVELHTLTGGKTLEALPLDVAVVDKDFLVAVIGLDESKTLFIEKLGNNSGCHDLALLFVKRVDPARQQTNRAEM